jgi:hypothetical protein
MEKACTLIRDSDKRPQGLTIDSSNEVYYAKILKKRLTPILPVFLMRGNQKVGPEGEETDSKTFCGNQLVAHMESARVPIPNHPYVESDFARVTKAAGRFTCTVGPNGEHGDTFDATKLALHGQVGRGPTKAKAIKVGNSVNVPRQGLLHPLAKEAIRRQRRR